MVFMNINILIDINLRHKLLHVILTQKVQFQEYFMCSFSET
jgi:hypothetical protein